MCEQMKESSEEQESSVEDQGSVKSSSEELQQFSPGSKIKVMCSYGGRILPRPHDGQLRYVGGETRIMLWNRRISFPAMASKLFNLVKNKHTVIKYQLPNEDLDALISVVTEDDFNNMLDEYEKMESRDSCSRLRLFLFPLSNQISNQHHQHQQSEDSSGNKNIDQQFIEAVNGLSIKNEQQQQQQTYDVNPQLGKPTPIKMQRQLSHSDRSSSSNLVELRGSPRTSPKAGNQQDPSVAPVATPPAHEIHPLNHHYYGAAQPQADQSPETSNTGSPKKQKLQQDHHHGYVKVNYHPCSSGETRGYQCQYHHPPPPPRSFCEQAFYSPEHHLAIPGTGGIHQPSCGCSRGAPAVLSPSRFREHSTESLRPVVHQNYDHQQQHFLHQNSGAHQIHHHQVTQQQQHRLAAEKSGAPRLRMIS